LNDIVPGLKANPLICLKVINITSFASASFFSSSRSGESVIVSFGPIGFLVPGSC